MKSRLQVFDDSARLYDEVRPGYPPDLYHAIRDFSGLKSGGSVLEIGCGTGQATHGFAKDFQMTCVEAGSRLAALTSRNFAGQRNVHVVHAYFEEWPLPSIPFDLLISATAFHHVDPATRFPKSAQALKSDGTAALFWNWPGEWEARLRVEIQTCYERYLPKEAEDFRSYSWEKRLRETVERYSVEAAAWFEPFEVRTFPWMLTYTAENYIKLLETYSGGHQSLAPERKLEFYDSITAVIRSRGGSIQTPLVSALLMARKKRSP
jgi:SAM-dependent methyltransferase